LLRQSGGGADRKHCGKDARNKGFHWYLAG
jgi:hypothetical protein